ncbi:MULTISPECIES: cupin domain-containing protein [unclassified Streptomyces]|uniref:cupin domain-containing protein n=1 Tax=unclassified Streptomyces TaxID=2593676 RepID=UPI002E81E63A|nr:cupin domain-containing protein [Streptomyces sp. NBC_00589]WTI34633.1 cupin domain-containing protein [Streptomyces sp. NBC_00775]WUB31694.1 cupin domain-containing protein [Streptomyces sp. NBC_00589]
MGNLFDVAQHLVDLAAAQQHQVIDDLGVDVTGIEGASGARAVSSLGVTMGVDQLVLQPGSAFPPHIHEGDHLLYVLSGAGSVHIDGVDHLLRAGQSVFIPAVYEHGLRGPQEGGPLKIISFSTPHHPVDSAHRMTVIRTEQE